VGTVNVGFRALTCPLFIVTLRERGPTAIHGKRPQSGRGSDRFLRSGDHFPNTNNSNYCVWPSSVCKILKDRVESLSICLIHWRGLLKLAVSKICDVVIQLMSMICTMQIAYLQKKLTVYF
jgi:hypothetical protein